MAPNAAKRQRVSKSNTNDQEMSSSQLFYETVKGSHEFKINGYSLAKGMGVGKYKTSGKFTVGGHDWMIYFYPDGYDQASKESVSFYTNLESPGEVEVRALFELNLQNQNRKGQCLGSSKSPVTFKAGNSIWGFSQYMKRSELETSDYLKDDCLIIHCTVGIVQTRVEEGKHYVTPVPPSDVAQNLKSLLQSEIGSDITFQVGNKKFRAHKSILAARSPIFRAQFFGLVGNPDKEAVVTKEFEPFVFKAMLLFLYSNELPETRELFDSDSLCTSTTIAQHLLAAADHYNLARLKLMCEAKLCEEIAASTVADTLALAERYQCQELKNVCLKFAAKPENIREVMKSDGYAHLEKWCPSLLTDLLKTNAVVDKK
ncbi:BTB/POZ and MATH domain-containing protein 3-like [Papaver somniferum]|uniref:BTB/POZ and MATH domain-containing protein 3-like n=1 Tax=Papaver somniferum TaxID=3469 RepID=UPI000E700F98|nr:BTB/POZ and MATH domain-containing protein 3-like [Papaver somniferum]